MDIDKGPSIPFFFTQLVFKNPYASSPESHREKRPRPLSQTPPPHFVYFCSCTYVVGISLSHLFCDTFV